jgi:hypothetical protein
MAPSELSDSVSTGTPTGGSSGRESELVSGHAVVAFGDRAPAR